jgi:hypothetical protein
MKRIFLVLFSALTIISCESSSTNPDTERFYSSPWNTTVHRSHGEVATGTGTIPAADETFTTTATLEKNGGFNMTASVLGYHMNQTWSYSWSTDMFFMNWEPCTDWYINDENDSMYLEYYYYDYDPSTGASFDWAYELTMVK